MRAQAVENAFFNNLLGRDRHVKLGAGVSCLWRNPLDGQSARNQQPDGARARRGWRRQGAHHRAVAPALSRQLQHRRRGRDHVLVLLGFHLRLYWRIIALENEPGTATRREFSIIHGVVSALLLAILFLVFLQPF